MKSGRLWILTVGLSLIAASTGHRAAAAQQLAPGSVEISPRVSFSHWNVKREGYGNVDNFTVLDFTPSLGVCLTPHHEVTAAVVIRHEAVNGDGNTRLGALTGYQYNFASRGGIIPFGAIALGANFGEGFSFDATSLVAPALTGGIRFLVGNAGSANVSLGYEHETDNHVSENRMVAAVGVSLFPWRLR
jgi:hypothetical protein